MEKKSQNNKPDLDKLFKDFDHPNPKINERAYLSMARYWPDESMPILIRSLDHKDLSTRRKSVKALGAFGAKVLPSIIKLFFSTNSRVLRVSCVKTLVQIVRNLEEQALPDDAMDVVVCALNDDTPEMILTVIPLLRLLGKQGLPLLIEACKDENILKALASITAIAEIDDPCVGKFLKSLLDNDSMDALVREGCIQALQNFPDTS